MRATTQPVWEVTPEKIREAVRRIVAAAHPLRIIMFGSLARGEARADSDLDIMVIESSVKNSGGEAARLRAALRGLFMAVDVVVVESDHYEYWKDTPGNVCYEAAQDGKPLYEAA